MDATGMMRWGPQPFTGIQRVEAALCRYALDQADIGIALYDEATRRYIVAGQRQLDWLRYIVNEDHERLDPNGLRFLREQIRFSRNETARRLASRLTGRADRKGLAYLLVKPVFRLLIWLHFGARFLAARLSPATASGKHVRAGAPLLLVSHDVSRLPTISEPIAQAGLRAAFVVHDLIPVLGPAWFSRKSTIGMRGFLERLLATNEPVIAVSNATAADLLAWHGADGGRIAPDRVTVRPLTGLVMSVDRGETPIQALAGRRLALFCSTVEPRKAHDLLVRIWTQLAQRIGATDLPDLVLVGREGAGMPMLQEALDEAGELRRRVHLLHDVDDKQLRWLYRHAEFALFPSRAEGWGLGVSEALGFGVPVIHTDIPALGEAAQRLMPCAPADDADAWTELLAGLIADPGRLRDLRERIAWQYDTGRPDDFAAGVFAHLRQLQDGDMPGAASNESLRVEAPDPSNPT